MKSSPWIVALAVVASTVLISNVAAQRGVIRGHVRDAAGEPLRYANVMLRWTICGTMTDDQGRYSLDAPVGAHDVDVSMMDYVKHSEHVQVGAGDTVTVDFTLEGRQSNEMVKVPVHKGPLVQEWELRDFDDNVWPTSTEPIRWESIEFGVRYVLTQALDSVVVSVIAEGQNVTATPFTVCGRFAFWDVVFMPTPEVYGVSGGWHYEGPILNVPADKFVPSSLECEAVQVGPGESIARGITFSFDPKAFECWTGEIYIQCHFIAGRNGVDWGDLYRIDIGRIRIPIRPIGQPLRHR